jgi:hypothetical protein
LAVGNSICQPKILGWPPKTLREAIMQPIVRQTLRQLVWGLFAVLAFAAATLSSAGVGYACGYDAGHADGFSVGARNTEALLQLVGQPPVDWNDTQVQTQLKKLRVP